MTAEPIMYVFVGWVSNTTLTAFKILYNVHSVKIAKMRKITAVKPGENAKTFVINTENGKSMTNGTFDHTTIVSVSL